MKRTQLFENTHIFGSQDSLIFNPSTHIFHFYNASSKWDDYLILAYETGQPSSNLSDFIYYKIDQAGTILWQKTIAGIDRGTAQLGGLNKLIYLKNNTFHLAEFDLDNGFYTLHRFGQFDSCIPGQNIFLRGKDLICGNIWIHFYSGDLNTITWTRTLEGSPDTFNLFSVPLSHTLFGALPMGTYYYMAGVSGQRGWASIYSSDYNAYPILINQLDLGEVSGNVFMINFTKLVYPDTQGNKIEFFDIFKTGTALAYQPPPGDGCGGCGGGGIPGPPRPSYYPRMLIATNLNNIPTIIITSNDLLEEKWRLSLPIEGVTSFNDIVTTANSIDRISGAAADIILDIKPDPNSLHHQCALVHLDLETDNIISTTYLGHPEEDVKCHQFSLWRVSNSLISTEQGFYNIPPNSVMIGWNEELF